MEYTFVERSDSNNYTDNALHDVNIMANNPQANIRYKGHTIWQLERQWCHRQSMVEQGPVLEA